MRVQVPCRGAPLLAHPMYNKSTAFTPRGARRPSGLERPAARRGEHHGAAGRGAPTATSRARPTPSSATSAWPRCRTATSTSSTACCSTTSRSSCPSSTRRRWAAPARSSAASSAARAGSGSRPRSSGRIDEALGNAPFDDVRLIVATDNESILGLGDQGAGGMAHPRRQARALHRGRRHPSRAHAARSASTWAPTTRPCWRTTSTSAGATRGCAASEYDALVDEFVQAVKRRFPRALLQWEDFSKGNAFALLERYRKVLPSFNDDIQGTAAVALAGDPGRRPRLPAMPLRAPARRDPRRGRGRRRHRPPAPRRARGARASRRGADRARVAVLDRHGLVAGGRRAAPPTTTGASWPGRPRWPSATGLAARRATRPRRGRARAAARPC